MSDLDRQELLKAIDDRIALKVRDLTTAALSRPALNKIQGGNVTVFDADGNKVAQIGTLDDGAVGLRVFYDDGAESFFSGKLADGTRLMRGQRADGSTALLARDYAGLLDASGNTIISDDLTAGAGLARPWLPLPTPVNQATGTWPATQAAAFATMALSGAQLQHPKILVYGNCYADVGTTGEVRLLVDGAQIGATISVPANSFANIGFTAARPAGANLFETVNFELQGRRLTGTGSIRAVVYGAYGVQS